MFEIFLDHRGMCGTCSERGCKTYTRNILGLNKAQETKVILLGSDQIKDKTMFVPHVPWPRLSESHSNFLVEFVLHFHTSRVTLIPDAKLGKTSSLDTTINLWAFSSRDVSVPQIAHHYSLRANLIIYATIGVFEPRVEVPVHPRRSCEDQSAINNVHDTTIRVGETTITDCGS